jgi:hypothetical protein
MIDILLTVAGAAACYLLARERFPAAPAAIATLGVAAGSGVLWYASGSDDPAATVRFAAGAVVAYGWVRASRGRSTRGQWVWATIGMALGLAAALVWKEPLAFSGTLSVADVLWSSRGGLLATSPAVYVSVIGLLLLFRVDRVLAAVGLTLLALTTLHVSAHAYWWSSAWPAPVAFVALTPYFVCGAAAVVDAAGRAVARRPVLAAGVLLAPLVVWNLTLMKAGTDASFDFDEPRWFGDVGAAQAKALHGWIGHPPSMPANIAFAMANGVHPSAYDLMASNRWLAGGESGGAIDIGERDTPFVGVGWHGAESDGGRSFRWASRSAAMIAPLDHVADLVVEVVARPYQPPNRPPQQLTLVVNGVAQMPVTLAAGWHPATWTVPQAAWRSGVNHIELRFAYDARPSDAGIPDGRSLAASIDAITVRVAP